MNIRILGIVAIMSISFVSNAVAQSTLSLFSPKLYWGENADLGVMLIKPNEMLVVDSNGNKHEKVLATESVSDVYISPNGKKLAYTTASSIWLVELETGQAKLVAKGSCYHLRWNADSMSVLFTVWETRQEEISKGSRFNLFWADGDGKNLKQVYP